MNHDTERPTRHTPLRAQLIATCDDGRDLPLPSMDRLLELLEEHGPLDTDDPQQVGALLLWLYEQGCPPSGLRAVARLWLGPLSAVWVAPAQSYFGSLEPWTFRAAVLTAGMSRPVFRLSPAMYAAIVNMHLDVA